MEAKTCYTCFPATTLVETQVVYLSNKNTDSNFSTNQFDLDLLITVQKSYSVRPDC